MNSSDEAPKLNPWPFIIGDVALLGLAAFVSWQSKTPLAGTPLIVVAVCVALGAVLACIPFLLNYTRRQDLVLAERQSEIAALAQSTAASAEQLSIAAASLHTIADTAAKAVKHVEHLPARIQEKVAEFKTQLNEVAVTENESLAQEVNTLRAAETERLESAIAGIRKTATELTALETATRKHLAEFSRTVAAAEEAASARTNALLASQGSLEKSLAAAHSAALAGIEAAVSRALATIDARLAAIPQAPARKSVPAPASENHHASPTPYSAPPVVPTATVISHKPLPALPETPSTASPAHAPAADTAPAGSATPATPETAPPARKRPPRRAAAHDDQPSLGLELPASPDDEYAQTAPDDARPTTAVSADGLTRLLVTAYIGIGNKLYVRGEGPGLSTDKGVPLQFVSIGKWRWETPDATGPISLKLFKNDELECSSVGTINLEPGQQHEVTANF
jgi:hypothetical protein